MKYIGVVKKIKRILGFNDVVDYFQLGVDNFPIWFLNSIDIENVTLIICGWEGKRKFNTVYINTDNGQLIANDNDYISIDTKGKIDIMKNKVNIQGR